MHANQLQMRPVRPAVHGNGRRHALPAKVAVRRLRAEAWLVAAGCIGAALAGVATAAWAVPYAMSQRATPAVGGELALVIIAGIAGWYAGIGCGALVLWARYRRRKGGIK